MLSFRLMLVSAGAGICLWGLFNLLDNLKQPELLRSTKVIVVKGCEPAESPDAAQLCPRLYCQKALLEAKVVPLRSRFTVTSDRSDTVAPNVSHLIAGTATSKDKGEQAFACLLDQHIVTAKRVLTVAELDVLSAQSGDWQL